MIIKASLFNFRYLLVSIPYRFIIRKKKSVNVSFATISLIALLLIYIHHLNISNDYINIEILKSLGKKNVK